MNRIPNNAVASVASGHPKNSSFAETLAKLKTRRESDPSSPLSLLSPIHYERNYAYPLVVWLHGPGDTERQLQTVLPLVSERNYLSVGPRGTVRERYETATYTWDQSERHLNAARRSVSEAIDSACSMRNVNPSRIFLAGLEAGGTMALRLAFESPERFAGVVSINGAFPTGGAVLRNWIKAKELPILLCRGMESERYTPDSLSDDLRLAYSANLCVHLRQYVEAGNDLTMPMLRDMDGFLMEIVTGSPVLVD